ncbi:hypothetical protein [Kocuria arenosa]|uniref:hypothetical protein n=1 Tax=Kocuria arenosa TaxID=3071446 RepID=UPI0034D5AFBD
MTRKPPPTTPRGSSHDHHRHSPRGDHCDRASRKLNRITVAGDVPAGVDGRGQALEGDPFHYSQAVEVA